MSMTEETRNTFCRFCGGAAVAKYRIYRFDQGDQEELDEELCEDLCAEFMKEYAARHSAEQPGQT
jgi:hypothetical protein